MPSLFLFWIDGRLAANEEDSPIARPQEPRIRINERISAKQIRVIDDEGNQLGIMSPEDGMKEAASRNLDLVEVAPNGVPPVCRILDYGKFKYQQSKREKESKKNQHIIHIKEVKYRPKIDVHDFNYKTNRVREFLTEGNKVKVTIMFRGRELAHPEFGHKILTRVVEATQDLAQEDFDPRMMRIDGRNMTMVLSPARSAGSS